MSRYDRDDGMDRRRWHRRHHRCLHGAMMKRLAFAFLAGLLAVSAMASPVSAFLLQKAAVTSGSSQVFLATTTGATAADRYAPLDYSATPAQTVDQAFTVFPVAGSVSSLRVSATVALTGSQAYDVTLYKNNVAQSITCTLNVSNQICDGAGSVSFAVGDHASILIHPRNSPGTINISLSSVFTPTTAGDTILNAWGNGFSTSASQGVAVSGINIGSNPANIPFPDGGTIDNLYAMTTAPGGGGTYTFAVRLNSVTQTLTCAVVDPATSCNDPSHPVTVVASPGTNSNINFYSIPSGSPTTAAVAGFGVRYRPTTTNSFAIISPSGVNDNASLNFYFPLSNGQPTGSTTESVNQQRSNAMTITKFAVKTVSNPGAAASGKARNFTIRVGASGTSATCQILETQTSCSWSGSLTINDGDKIDIEDAPTGAPNISTPYFGVLANR
jgi:hypothetical protein